MLRVAKFGGTSCATPESLARVISIIKSSAERKYIVVSAPGKRAQDDTKVTDMLYQWAHAKKNKQKDDAHDLSEGIIERYELLAVGHTVSFTIRDEWARIEAEFAAHKNTEYVASRGEYLMAKLLADVLGATFVDAASCICLDDDRQWDKDATSVYAHIRDSASGVCVIPGFYGLLHSGRIGTFSRGGSDITGAIVAASMRADVYENWTDVNGIYTSDPRKYSRARLLEKITYTKLRRMANAGAQVFHPDAVEPCEVLSIPIHIRNTYNIDGPGTLITA
jgi:aspartate kinase